MENQLFNKPTEPQLELTPFIKSELKSLALWAKFLAILGFVGVGIMFFGGLALIFAGSMFSHLTKMPIGVLAGIYLVMAVIYFFPMWFLYKFAINMGRAVGRNEQLAFTTSVSSLKAHYKFVGIMAIVMLSIYLLAFMMGVMSALAGA